MGKRSNFVLGALVGAGLGMIFAPKKGSELRKDLKVKFDELVQKAKEIDVNEITESVEAKVQELKNSLNDLDKEKALEVAKKKASEIKDKAEDLVQLAVDKGTPILENAANEVKDKTIQVAKEAINRLEKQEAKDKEKSKKKD